MDNNLDDKINYDFNNVIISNKKELNSHVTDEEIMLFYYGEFEIDEQYMSPFRHETSPSFSIFYNTYGWLRWKDWGLFEKAQDAVAYVCKIKNLNFYSALNVIYDEIVNGDVKRTSTKSIYKITKNKGNRYTKGVKIRRSWRQHEIEYWSMLDVTIETLTNKFNIYPCDGIWFNKILWHKSQVNDPLFIYLFNKSTESWKAYRPKCSDSKNKFKVNNITNHIQGYSDLPKTGNVLVITSSQKDRIPFYVHAGLHSIAPHNEGIIIDKFIINDLKSRFKNIYVCMNNDTTGLKSNSEHVKRYDIKSWHVPIKYKAKDPTELYAKYGKDVFLNEINHITSLK